MSAYSRATPSADASWPSETSIRSAGPLSARPPTIGLTATTGNATRAGGGDRLPDPRHRQDRPDRDDRVGRAHDDRVGGRQRRGNLRRRTSGLDAREPDLAHVGRLPAMHEVLLELEPAVVGQHLGPHRLVGHRQDPRARRPATPAGPGTRRSAGRPPAAAPSARCAARGHGRPARTSRAPRTRPAAPSSRGCRPRCPSPTRPARSRPGCRARCRGPASPAGRAARSRRPC